MEVYMKKDIFKKSLLSALAVAALGFFSCREEKNDVKTVIVGTGSDSKLYCYLDEKGLRVLKSMS